MSDDSQRPIVVKRINKGAHGHHGGAWKIAYADFVTAMMAFFLLMWVLGAVSKGKLSGIADYFNTPFKVALEGGESSGNASSIIPGGGEDLQKVSGEVRNVDSRKADESSKNQQAAAEKKVFETIQKKIRASIQGSPQFQSVKNQLMMEVTAEGLRIQIMDEQNRPMFAAGSANLQPYMLDLLNDVGEILNELPNYISISGHTDATPYPGGHNGYSNWELSADRANSSRRQLILGGLQEGKILRVVGLGSAVPLNRLDPTDPVNRRISIIVLTQEAADNIIAASSSEPAGVAPDEASSSTDEP